MQGSGGQIKGPATAEAGTTVTIHVQGEAPTVEVTLAGDDATTKLPVQPDGTVQIPVPNTPGRLLLVTTPGGPPVGQLSILIVSSAR